MTRLRSLWLQPLLVVAVLTASSCTGSSGKAAPTTSESAPASTSGKPTASAAALDVVDPAFLQRANTACAPYATYFTAHPLSINIDAVQPAELVKVLAYFKVAPFGRTFVPTMDALVKPARGADLWAAYLVELRRYQANFTKELSAAKASDVKAFEADATVASGLLDELANKLSIAGFQAHDACTVVWTG